MTEMMGSTDSGPLRSAADLAVLYKLGRHRFCFVCGKQVEPGVDLSAEHIVPQWLIRQLDLTKGGMQLPNFEKGASLRSFLRSKVDCCLTCNNALSRSLEPLIKDILSVARQGDLRTEHRHLMLLWLAKIYYANSFAGMSFADDPSRISDPTHGKLTHMPDHIAILDNIQAHLASSIADPEEATMEELGSVFTFRCQSTVEPDFYYGDGHQQMPIVVFRYGSLGIIAYLAGGNRAEGMFDRRSLAWNEDSNPFDLDVEHIQSAKKTRLINEQLLDVASIIAQIGTAYLDAPPIRIAGMQARSYQKNSAFGGRVVIPLRQYYFRSLLGGNTDFYDRWLYNGGSLLVDRRTGRPISFSYVMGPAEGGLAMSHVRHIDEKSPARKRRNPRA
ncbi:hypothetical protein [Paenarthrobacter nicotinovorans]|uniref:hypothetical protein n=1 Tax=Paenarthrobacter nicotinovorans TaxID=29320 RepID=UPI00374A8904